MTTLSKQDQDLISKTKFKKYLKKHGSMPLVVLKIERDANTRAKEHIRNLYSSLAIFTSFSAIMLVFFFEFFPESTQKSTYAGFVLIFVSTLLLLTSFRLKRVEQKEVFLEWALNFLETDSAQVREYFEHKYKLKRKRFILF